MRNQPLRRALWRRPSAAGEYRSGSAPPRYRCHRVETLEQRALLSIDLGGLPAAVPAAPEGLWQAVTDLRRRLQMHEP